MIVAVFGDVHANLIALEVFLARVADIADAYVCLGDTVNYGPWNDECLERVHALPEVTMIEGNHERIFLGTESVAQEIDLVRSFYASSRSSFTRTDLVAALPQTHALGPFTCVHTIDDKRVFPDTDIVVDRDCVIGHSHYQYQIVRNGKTIVNPGSVGQNRDRIDHVDYAIYDTELNSFSFESVPYEFDRFLAEVRTRDYPDVCLDYYARKLAEARSR